jgi:hypothetical protein
MGTVLIDARLQAAADSTRAAAIGASDLMGK